LLAQLLYLRCWDCLFCRFLLMVFQLLLF